MKADPAAQERLLELQGIDSALDRIATRRRTLPEFAELEELAAATDAASRAEVTAATAEGDHSRAQRRLEQDVQAVRDRAARDQRRLDAGEVASPRELESLASEISSLARRQAVLEDELLEVMQAREDAAAALAIARADLQRQAAQRADAEARRDAALAACDLEAAELTERRGLLAATLPADLLRSYERIRTTHQGVGAAALRQRRCEGCHLELSGMEAAAARDAPADEVLSCEQCRRILVRTAESGL